ncbi:hypothetical protein TYRP_019378 [Tyrophagus putrescentiae]|nr:hypothetical protein TYRP_019378 [Tyrophagus putrescentiae]
MSPKEQEEVAQCDPFSVCGVVEGKLGRSNSVEHMSGTVATADDSSSAVCSALPRSSCQQLTAAG